MSLGINRSRFGEAVFENWERGNRWMASAVAEDSARATLSENRYKTAGWGVVRDSEQSESI